MGVEELKRKPLEKQEEAAGEGGTVQVSQVHRFDALMHLAPTYSTDDFLKELPKYADLVRGLWVCKSSLLFDDDEYGCKRDRILLEFTKMDSIPMKEVDRVIEKDLMMRRILIPLCRRRITLQDCKFIQEADSSFVRHYPCVVKDQESAWSVCRTTMPDSQEFFFAAINSK